MVRSKRIVEGVPLAIAGIIAPILYISVVVLATGMPLVFIRKEFAGE
jgi:hypothetical protein